MRTNRTEAVPYHRDVKVLGQILLASLCATLALVAAYCLGSLALLLVDPNYHDGVAAVGGFVIGVIAAIFVFRAVWRRTNHTPNAISRE